MSQATTFDRRAGIWPEKLRFDLEQRLAKRAADFNSPHTLTKLLQQATVLDAAAPTPLNNEELSQLLDQLVRSV